MMASRPGSLCWPKWNRSAIARLGHDRWPACMGQSRWWMGFVFLAGCSGSVEETCVSGDSQRSELSVRECVDGTWSRWRELVCEADEGIVCDAPDRRLPCADESREQGLCRPEETEDGVRVCLEDGSGWQDECYLAGLPSFSMIDSTCQAGAVVISCGDTCLYRGRTTCQDNNKWGPCVCNPPPSP